MAQVQDKKGLCSGYLFERTSSCEVVKKTEHEGDGESEPNTKIVNKLLAKRFADL